MNPRHQIFISSTFRDLRKERQAVLDAILQLGHCPSGMEVFPAADATPWNVIETIIAESDYYILIIGGVYGSTDEKGISYTEREHDFAVSKGIPVLVFLHGDPSKIPVGMSEIDPIAQKRLSDFRNKVEDTHHCKYWSTPEELKSQVVVGIVHAIRVTPRTGWIRGNTGDSAETLKKLTDSLEENSTLKLELKVLRDSLGTRSEVGGQLASGSDIIELHFIPEDFKEWTIVISWDELFKKAGAYMLSDIPENEILFFLSRELSVIAASSQPNPEQANKIALNAKLEKDDFDKIIYQFLALEYLEPITIVKQTDLFGKPRTQHIRGFRLTKYGSTKLGKLLAIKKS
jgi:hypothetical protein